MTRRRNRPTSRPADAAAAPTDESEDPVDDAPAEPDEVDDTVKVLQIDGLLPGDAKYPLRRAGRAGKASVPAW